MKTFLGLLLGVAALLGVVGGVAYTTVMPTFLGMESADARQDMARLHDAVQEEITSLGRTTEDYGAWDAAAAFVETGRPEFRERSLTAIGMSNVRVNLVGMVRTDGEVMAEEVFGLGDGERAARARAGLLTWLKAETARSGLLVRGKAAHADGILRLGDELYMVAVRPVIDSKREGPTRGAIVMGRLLDDEAMRALGTRTRLKAALRPVDAGPAEREALGNTAGGATYLKAASDSQMVSWELLRDLDRKPVGLLRVESDRANYREGVRAMRFFMAVLTVLGLLAVVTGEKLIHRARQARIAARVHEERLRRLVSEAQDMIFRYEYEPKPHYAYLSPSAATLLGYPAEELLRTPEMAIKAVHPDDREWFVRLARGEEAPPPMFMVRFLRKDGTVVWTEQQCRVERNPAGRITAVEGIVRDITERRRVEEALRQGEERLRVFIEHAPAALAMFDKDMCYVATSARWRRDYGLEDEALTGRSHYDVMPEIPERWRMIHRRALAGEVVRAEEDRFTRPNGRVQWLKWEVRPWRDGSGAVAGIVIFTEDITVEKEAKEALQSSEDRYRRLIETANEGVWVLDTNARTVLANAKMARMLGWRVEEMLGRELWTFADAKWRVVAMEKLAMRERGVSEQHEFCFKRKDGGMVWALVSGTPLLDAEGRYIGSLAMVTDITRQKDIQEELEAASRAKDHFLAVLSHELRTPLSPMLATTEMLLADSRLPAELREDITAIHRNAALEARLIDDLLDMTRITRGKIRLMPAVVDVRDVINQTVEICREDAAVKDIVLAVDAEPQERWVAGDPVRLQQVLWNLLKNAVKFTSNGGRVMVRAWNPEDGHVAVEVTDTGIGIKEDLLPHVFEAFEQGGRGREFGGLGLGLAITKALVDLHGGTIKATSRGVHQGATFTVTLPTTQSPRPAGPASNGTERPMVKSLHVVLVEDHVDTALVMARVLRGMGHEVRVGHSVREGLDAVAAGPCDLVISDIGLPDGTGLDLMREVRRTSPVPGIALSGFGMDDDVRKSKEVGFGAHLTKPVNLVTLADAIEQSIGGGREN